MSKFFYIKTYGCQMNEYDSDKVRDILQALQYKEVESEDTANLIIINTCAIREKSSEKLYSQLGRYKDHEAIICVMGCVAQAEGSEVMDRAPYVDIVLGSSSYHKLPEALENLKRQAQKDKADLDKDIANKDNIALNKRTKKNYEDTMFLDFEPIAKFDDLPKRTSASKISEFLSIQEGCDKFCNFCIVPFTRGKEYSRDVESIIEETRDLVSKGAYEITLLGQNVTAYIGYDKNQKKYDMGDLLRIINEKVPELLRIRYTTSHPKDMNDSLFNAHRDIKKLVPCLHLPVQSGSDHILKKMNRKHNIDLFINIVNKLREIRPGMQFSSDFIVGYPEETDEDFRQTVELVNKVFFIQSFSFNYSRRPGTPAGHSDKQVPEDIKNVRLQELQSILKQQQTEFNASFKDKIVEVLVESMSTDRANEQQGYGKTEYNQSVFFKSKEQNLLGRLVKIKINDTYLNSLRGELVV